MCLAGVGAALLAWFLLAPVPAGDRAAQQAGTDIDQWGIVSPRALSPTRLARYQVAPGPDGPVRFVETRSARAITLELESIDPARMPPSLLDFRLRGTGDPAYREPVAPVRAGLDRQVVGFDSARRPLPGARLHLLFPHPLEPDQVYHLAIADRFFGGGHRSGPLNVELRYRPERISGSIQVNQVGFEPAARKIAFVGNWLGTAGALPIDATGFAVIDLDGGAVVHEGGLDRRAMADPWSGNDVYQADFSTLTRPGRYQVRVAGLGVSEPFRIAARIHEPIYRRVMRLFYHSRNGTPVLAPFADPGYERPDGGVPAALDGQLHASVADSALGCAEADCRSHPVAGGWFDAGDYGQYVPNAAPVWYWVGAAFDLAPGRFMDGDLGIPESGNGIPDLLDELEWGMGWMLSMQDDGDGGVYFRITSRSWDDMLPHQLTQPRLIAEKTTHASASFAAAAAIHARLIEPYRPSRARQALAAAQRAWEFLDSHPQWPAEGERYRNPPGIHAGEYAESSADDNRLWAAAELYRATGEPRYRVAYERLAPRVHIDPTANVSYGQLAMAAFWAWTMAADRPGGDPDVDPALARKARDAVIAAGNWRIAKANEHPFRAPMHQFVGFTGWGSFAESTRATVPLLQAYRLTAEPRFLDWAWETPNIQLGANPQSLCYITGVGARSPRWPLSKLSRFDSQAAPLNGIPVIGPHYALHAISPQMIAVNAAYLPPNKPRMAEPRTAMDFADAYPALRRYTDSDYLPPMCEPTVADYAQVGVAYGLLRAPGLGAEIQEHAKRASTRTPD